MEHAPRRLTAVRLRFCAALAALLTFNTAHAADHVVFVTDFGLYGRHAYYFVAMDKGYYADENIDVEIVRSQGSAASIKQVANNTAQLGFADAFAVVLGRANDDIPTKLVAMVYPKSPHAIYVLKDSGISKPQDLAGKTLADTAFSSIPKLFATYAKAAGFDPSATKWIAANSDALPGMLSTKRVDGVGQYSVGEALLAAAAAPQQLREFLYADAGLDYYSNGIVASDAIIQNNPDLVRRFVKATLRGLATAMADPKAAAEIMHKHHSEIDVDIAAGEMKKVKELAEQPKLGAIDPARVQKTIDIVAATYPLKKTVLPSDVYTSGFVPD